jgi:hypothetical protein
MYDKIDTLANKPKEDIMKMKAHESRQQPEVDLKSIELRAQDKTRTKSEKRNSKHSQMSRMTRDSGSESESRNSQDEDNHRRMNWRDTQECY